MRATITADAGRGPGYATIVVAEAPESAGPEFLLRRASDQKSLTTSGWQENETRLSPESWDRPDAATLRLQVGPGVVDALDDLDAYRLTLANAAPCVLEVGPLAYSPMRGGHGLGEAVAAPMPEEPPLEVPAEEPEAPATEGLTAPDAPPLALDPQPPARSRGPFLLLLALLLLAVLGFALWWFVLRTPATPPMTAPGAGAEAETAAAPQTPGQDAAKQNAATPNAAGPNAGGQTPPQQSPLRMARELLRGQAQPEQSLEAAKPLRTAQASPEQSDAAFLLLEDAAQKGNAAAMYMVAQFYDPQSSLPRGSLPVDLTQAKRWYEAALQKGQAEARPALEALRAYARAQADKGDAEAAALLQGWK